MKKGLVHVYTGEGKGKTTAALGLALRCAGCGFEARIFQFCKNTPSGEVQALKDVPRISLFRGAFSSGKFLWEMDEEEKAAWRIAQQNLFDQACEAAQDRQCDLVVLDEIFAAIREKAVSEEELLYLLSHRYRGCEMVLTGRDAGAAIIARADYVTRMEALRHPYRDGVPARRGIEY